MKRKAIVEAAAEAGLLPHEWLLGVVRGEPVIQREWDITYDEQGNEESRELKEQAVYPGLEVRMDAAKAAAGYFAPRLQAQTVELSGSLGVDKLSDEELEARLKELLVDREG